MPPPAGDVAGGADRKYNVAMVCDFFYPRLGGVEMHIWSLSQCLLKMGHKVIVVTNLYPSSAGERVGVRHMTNGLKVYYMPIVAMVDQATMPTYYGWFPLFRDILLRERIEIVHGHAATSPLMHECLIQAKTMGLKTIFTDHSLFGFADAASINVNKYLKFTLSNVDHCICVSHTDRENLVLRAHLDPTNVSTIPNAVDASKFTPEVTNRPPWPGSSSSSSSSSSSAVTQAALGPPPSSAAASHASRATASLLQQSGAPPAALSSSGHPTHNPSLPPRINIVLLSRLVYRKGIDLVINVIPAICAKYPHVYFIIGGDGPKRLLLEEMRERHSLHDRVELLGAVAHKDVRSVLTRGHIFLNCSLTEAFCIAILEAACCGCFVVSTRVGGVPEVLPSRMTRFAEPRSEDLIAALEEAIPLAQHVDPWDFHLELRDCYNWPEVAVRTCKVYERVTSLPAIPLLERLRRYFGVGRVFGPIACILITCIYLMWLALEAVRPREDIDVVPDLPLHRMRVVTAAEEAALREAAAAGGLKDGAKDADRASRRPLIVTPSELKRGYAALARPGAAAPAAGSGAVPVQQLLLAHRPAAGTLSLSVSTLRSPCSRAGDSGSVAAGGAGSGSAAPLATAAAVAAAGGSARARTPSPPPFRPPARTGSGASLAGAAAPAGPTTPGLVSPVRSRHGSSASGDALGVGAGIALASAAAAAAGSGSPAVPPRPASSSGTAGALVGNDSRRGSITSPFRPTGPSHMRRRGSSAIVGSGAGSGTGGPDSLTGSPVVDAGGAGEGSGSGRVGGDSSSSGGAAVAAALAAAAGVAAPRPRSTPAGAAGVLSPRPVLPPPPEAPGLDTDGVPSTPVAGVAESETPSIFDRLSSVDRFRLGFAGPSSLSLASLVPGGSMLALGGEVASSSSSSSGGLRRSGAGVSGGSGSGRGGLGVHGAGDADASTASLSRLAPSASTDDFYMCLSPASVAGGGAGAGGGEEIGFSLGHGGEQQQQRVRGAAAGGGVGGGSGSGNSGPVLGSFDGSIFTDESDDGGGLTAPPSPSGGEDGAVGSLVPPP